MASSTSFYSYTDANGVQVVVQKLADVPEQYREQVKRIDLSKPAITLPASPSENAQATPADGFGLCGKGTFLNVPSFILGAGTGLALGCMAMLALRRTNRLLSLVVAGVVMAALSLGYIAYVRRQAGLSGSGLATPATLVDDARAAASTLNKRNQEQQRALDELDKQH
jgi:hypothetical protein